MTMFLLLIAAAFAFFYMRKPASIPTVFALFLFAFVPAFLHSAIVAPRVDGSWLSEPCYGCPGDKVRAQMRQQQEAYDEAKEALNEDHSIGNLIECAHFALFSYVKAGYLLLAADQYKKQDDKANAIAYYQNAAQAAYDATKIALNEKFVGPSGENVPLKSRGQGKTFLKYANKQLIKLGAGQWEPAKAP